MRNGDWFQTFTGKKFYIFDPQVEDIDIVDIAHSLSLLCRFQGHTREFYSVAQHSIHAAAVLEKLTRGTEFSDNSKIYLCALLHDATEAYVGDLIRPIKGSLPDYQFAEADIWTCILKKFELWDTWNASGVSDLVKQADEVMLVTEKRDLLPVSLEWGTCKDVEPDAVRILPKMPHVMEKVFLNLFEELQ